MKQASNVLTSHLGIQPSGNLSPQKGWSPTLLGGCGFDPRDLQNIRLCEFRL